MIGRRDNYRCAASYVDDILKGARREDLLVEQPSQFELLLNLNTAKALVLAVLQAPLLRANEVIQRPLVATSFERSRAHFSPPEAEVIER